ncbi:hypothetical protein L7F22_036724 [Adiantum nelumboides]|nr:hypothetical protein [Adiantum nelumboides]
MIFDEITTKAIIHYEKIVRNACREIEFVFDDVGLDDDHCKALINIEQQSPYIAQGVHSHFTKKPEEVSAGDQGHMFGYATDETEGLMPLSHVLATKIGAKLIEEFVIKPVVLEKYLDEKTIFHLNPSGRFVIGGPHGDADLTGRKIIIDTYGGWGAHGGGAFSGKEPTKVDRNVLYDIGVPEPLSVFVDTYGIGTILDVEILEIIKQNFDFCPGMIDIHLNLRRCGNKRYQKTTAYGHFGRYDSDLTWETMKLLKFEKA